MKNLPWTLGFTTSNSSAALLHLLPYHAELIMTSLFYVDNSRLSIRQLSALSPGSRKGVGGGQLCACHGNKVHPRFHKSTFK